MRYALKIKSNSDNPAYDSIFKLPYRNLYEHASSLSLGESINRLFREAEIDKNKILSSKIPEKPIWDSDSNKVSFKLSGYDKNSTNPAFFKAKFLSDVLPDYENYYHIYTDGSKQNDKTGFGLYSEDISASQK